MSARGGSVDGTAPAGPRISAPMHVRAFGETWNLSATTLQAMWVSLGVVIVLLIAIAVSLIH